MQDKKRKIIQIMGFPESERQESCLYVLCNDGSLWLLTETGDIVNQIDTTEIEDE